MSWQKLVDFLGDTHFTDHVLMKNKLSWKWFGRENVGWEGW
jgi:hypothetical protein